MNTIPATNTASTVPNAAERQLLLVLGLCPALATSDMVANALGLGAALVLSGTVSFGAMSLLKQADAPLRWMLGMLILAATLGCLGLAANAWLPELYRSLELFLPLLTSNLALLVLAERSSRQAVPRAALDGLRAGASMALVLLILALAREIVGRGSVLHDARGMLGDWAALGDWQLFRADMGFLLAMLPPGAFIAFGLLLATRNWMQSIRRAEVDGPDHNG